MQCTCDPSIGRLTSPPSVGSSLLTMPLSACISSADLTEGCPASICLPPADTYGRTLAALLDFVDRHEKGTADARASALASYHLAVAPIHELSGSMIACWAPDGAAARLLDKAVCWKRARLWRATAESEWRALCERGTVCSLERMLARTEPNLRPARFPPAICPSLSAKSRTLAPSIRPHPRVTVWS